MGEDVRQDIPGAAREQWMLPRIDKQITLSGNHYKTKGCRDKVVFNENKDIWVKLKKCLNIDAELILCDSIHIKIACLTYGSPLLFQFVIK